MTEAELLRHMRGLRGKIGTSMSSSALREAGRTITSSPRPSAR